MSDHFPKNLCVTICLGAAWVLMLADVPLIAEWRRHTIDASSQGADGIRLGDVNRDGLPDLVTGWEEGGVVRVYTNPGPQRVRAPWPAVTVGEVNSPEDAVFVDLDGDGQFDVVSCCEGKTRTVYVHWGSAQQDWQTEAIPALAGQTQWMFATPLHIDRSTGIDLVIGAKGPGAELGWLRSPKQPRQLADWSWHPLTAVGWIMSIEAVDMDGDGQLDILYSDRKGAGRGVHWLRQHPAADPQQPWEKVTLGATDREVMFLAIGDLTGNGLADVVAAVKDGPITWFERLDESGRNWQQHEITLPSEAGSGKGVAICDINLDGRMDVAFTCEHAAGKVGVGWLEAPADLRRPDWKLHDISGVREGAKFDLIQMLDLDGDGDLDLLTCEERENLGVIWYENPTRQPRSD